jgi:hypothetical protein
MELSVTRAVASATSEGASTMAVIINKDNGGGGGNVLLGLILGAVLLAVGVVGFFMWDNYKSGGAPKAVVITQGR